MDWLKKAMDFLNEKMGTPDKKRRMENYVLVIVIGVVLIIIGNTLFGSSGSVKTEDRKNEQSAQSVAKNSSDYYQDELTLKVESILSKIEGAGKVSVLITYISGKEVVPAFDSKKNENDTQERDSGGGTRNIRQSESELNVAYEETQGQGKKPVILKEIHPPVKGVLVVAEGASDAKVRESISRSIQVLLDVPLHKIQVLERTK